MNDHDDNRAGARGGSDLPGGGVHLSDDVLSDLLDRRPPDGGEAAARRHLAGCPACAGRLAELGAVRTLLRGLPEPRLRRSFQLSPAAAHGAPSFWDRLGLRLLPMLPVLRAATVAVALLLVAAVAADRLTEPEPSGLIREDAAPALTPAPTQVPGLETRPPAPTRVQVTAETAALQTNVDVTESEAGSAGGQTSKAAPGSDAAPGDVAAYEAETGVSRAADSSLAQTSEAPAAAAGAAQESIPAESTETGSGGVDAAMIAPEPAPTHLAAATPSPLPTAPPIPTSTASPLPSPTATPTPTAIAVEVASDGGQSGWWRVAQALFAMLLLVCLAGLLLARRAGGHFSRPH